MKTRTNGKKVAGIGDAAVQAKTGKNWSEWFSILDRAGAKKMGHREIVAVVHEEHGVGPWWRQMVAVAYEQDRGLRDKHEKPEGYQISRSKTFTLPASRLFKAWKDKRVRDRWLDNGPVVIRKATADKSLRITWSDTKTSVEVNFYPKGDAKTQVTVQHSKLADAKAAARMKTFWAAALGRLQEVLTA